MRGRALALLVLGVGATRDARAQGTPAQRVAGGDVVEIELEAPAGCAARALAEAELERLLGEARRTGERLLARGAIVEAGAGALSARAAARARRGHLLARARGEELRDPRGGRRVARRPLPRPRRRRARACQAAGRARASGRRPRPGRRARTARRGRAGRAPTLAPAAAASPAPSAARLRGEGRVRRGDRRPTGSPPRRRRRRGTSTRRVPGRAGGRVRRRLPVAPGRPTSGRAPRSSGSSGSPASAAISSRSSTGLSPGGSGSSISRGVRGSSSGRCPVRASGCRTPSAARCSGQRHAWTFGRASGSPGPCRWGSTSGWLFP
jgi:hypothetical protein